MELVEDLSLLKKRDVSRFIQIRDARPSDDWVLGDLLVKSFKETYAQKLPSAITTLDREMELRDVHSRRKFGVVRILELGYKVIGTYSLLSPRSDSPDAWVPNASVLRCLAVDPEFHSLKLSEKLLVDAKKLASTWRSSAICLHVQKGAKGVARLYEKAQFKRDLRGDKVVFGSEIEGYIYEVLTGDQPFPVL